MDDLDARLRSQARIATAVAGAFIAGAFAAAYFARRRESPLRRAVAWGGAAAGSLGLLGAFLSQYAPVFGDVLSKNLGTPFSPARMNLLLEHTFIFGTVGLVLGAGATALRSSELPAP